MRIESILNASTKKQDVAFFEISGELKEETVADAFLRSVGVDISCTDIDKIDDEFYWAFMIELDGLSTKAKTLKWLRAQLAVFKHEN